MTQLIKNDVVYSLQDFYAEFPHTSFAQPIDFASFGFEVVFPTPKPIYDPETEELSQSQPVKNGLGKWEQVWVVVPLSVQASTDIKTGRYAQLKVDLRTAISGILDTFALEKGYPTILDACSYTTSTVPNFKNEATKAVAQRDAMWLAHKNYLNDVKNNVIPKPKTVAEVIAVLPVPTWV